MVVNKLPKSQWLKQQACYMLAAAGQLFNPPAPGLSLGLKLCFELGAALCWDMPFSREKEKKKVLMETYNDS